MQTVSYKEVGIVVNKGEVRLTLIKSKVLPSVVMPSSVTVTCSAALQPVILQSSKFDNVDSGSAE